MKYCPHCGLPVHNKRAGICEECGQPLSGSARRKEQSAKESGRHESRDPAGNPLPNFEFVQKQQKKMMRRFKAIAALITLTALLFTAYAVVNMATHQKNRKKMQEHAKEYSAPEFSVPEFTRPEFSVPEFSVPEFTKPEFSWPEPAAPAYDDPVIPSPGALDGDDTGETSAEETEQPYSVRLTGHEMTTNLFGENVLVLDLEFINNSDSAVSFFHALTARVTQDGTQCMQTASNVDPALTGVDAVEPGALGKVQLAYVAAPDTETQITVSAWYSRQVVMEENFTS